MIGGNENSSDKDLDICGISRSYSQTKLSHFNEVKQMTQYNENTDKKILARKDKEDPQSSISFNDLNVLGLRDFYLGSNDNQMEIKTQIKQENNDSQFLEFQQNEQFNTKLDELGFKLNEVIGHYLNEFISQPRLSLDSFPLQNSESLDEEKYQQILDSDLIALKQRIYKQIVDKINLSVIQSVQSFESSCQLNSQSNQTSTAFSKELFNSQTRTTQFSSKSLSHSIFDLQSQLNQSVYTNQSKINKKSDESSSQYVIEKEESKEDLQNKLKLSLNLNYQQQQVNNQLKEELSKFEKKNQNQEHIEQQEVNKLLIENQKLKEENQKLIEFIQTRFCDKCKPFTQITNIGST